MERNFEETVVKENSELKQWIREMEMKNDSLEKENEALRKALKAIL